MLPYLGRNIEAIPLLSVELRGVQYHCDLPLQHHEHHGVLVCAGHALGRVTLDPGEINDVRLCSGSLWISIGYVSEDLTDLRNERRWYGGLRALAYWTASGAMPSLSLPMLTHLQ